MGFALLAGGKSWHLQGNFHLHRLQTLNGLYPIIPAVPHTSPAIGELGGSTLTGHAKIWVTQHNPTSFHFHWYDHHMAAVGIPPTEAELDIGWADGPTGPYHGDDEVVDLIVVQATGLGVYKAVYNTNYNHAVLSNPCHPLHRVMVYVWGGTYDAVVDKYFYAPRITTPLLDVTGDAWELTPTIAVDGNGVPEEHTGTTDLAAMVVMLGVTGKPYANGLVCSWTDLAWTAGDESFPAALPSFDVTRNGIHWVGGGDSCTCTVTDKTLVPDPRGDTYEVTVYVPTAADLILQGYNFAAADDTVEFTLPDTTGFGTVDAGAGTYSYTWEENTVDSSRKRVWTLQPPVASAWATAHDEVVTPTDLPCTIEERGLAITTDFNFPGFNIRRDVSESAQLPSDAGGVLPSPWVADDGNVAVGQLGKDTTVTVAAGALGSSVTRTLMPRESLADRIIRVNLPLAYQVTKHLPGGDIRHWDGHKFVRIDYESDKAITLQLTVAYNTVVVIDDHMTGSERITNLQENYTPATVTYSFACNATSGPESVYIDLQAPNEVWLFDVSAFTVAGFVGGGAEWAWVLHDLVLNIRNPTLGTEAGRLDVKFVYVRQSALGNVPICYTAGTFTAEGLRCIRPPDQIVTLCDEAGIDFVERLTGRVSGTVLDHLWSISYWVTLLHNTEGVHVDYDPTASPNFWQPGHAAYDAAFVDGDGFDMLGNFIPCSDCTEQFDKLLTTNTTTFGNIPMQPRVGSVLLCSGFRVPVVVKKHLNGSAHGLERTVSGYRTGSDKTVTLWEWNGVSYDLADTGQTDDWSRYRFAKGVRENRGGQVAAGIIVPVGAAFSVYNELRVWLDVVTEALQDRLDAKRGWHGSVLLVRPGTLLWSGESVSPDDTATLIDTYIAGTTPNWTVVQTPLAANPACAMVGDGDITVFIEDGDGNLLELTADPLGRNATMTTITGYTRPACCTEPLTGQVLLLARNGATGNMDLLRDDGSGRVPVGVVAASDDTEGAIACLGDGSYSAFVVASGVIVEWTSPDRGRTWT